MRIKLYLMMLLSAALTAGCQPKATPVSSLSVADMEAVVQQKMTYPDLPSASGLETAGVGYYVAGDDSPYLYLLDNNYQLVEKTALFDTSSLGDGRIPKAEKPDLESMLRFSYHNEVYLLLLGSGATAARQKAYVVRQADPKEVKAVDVSAFYTFLQKILARQRKTEVLNIEGMAADADHVYLLQRRLAVGVNTIFRFDKAAFLQYLLEDGDLPNAAAFYVQLPQLGNFQAGFSGACIYNDRLFFTASLERTTDAIADGEVLGSFVGFIPLYSLGRAGDAANPLEVTAVQLKNADGTLHKGKAEAIVVQEQVENNGYKAVLVSDDDLGHSELLVVTLRPKVEAKP